MAKMQIQPLSSDTYECGGTVPAYYAVILSSGKIVVSAASNTNIIGIALEDGVTGDKIKVIRLGRCPMKIVTAASVVAGARIMADAAGKGLLLATTGNKSQITALEAASSNGDIIEVFVNALEAAFTQP